MTPNPQNVLEYLDVPEQLRSDEQMDEFIPTALEYLKQLSEADPTGTENFLRVSIEELEMVAGALSTLRTGYIAQDLLGGKIPEGLVEESLIMSSGTLALAAVRLRLTVRLLTALSEALEADAIRNL